MGVVCCDHKVHGTTEEEFFELAKEHALVHMEGDHEAFQSEEFRMMLIANMHTE